MKEIKINKDVNATQLLKELKIEGIAVEGIAKEKNNNLTIRLIDDAKETALRNAVNSHVKIPELTLVQRIDKISTIADVKKYLKGEL